MRFQPFVKAKHCRVYHHDIGLSHGEVVESSNLDLAAMHYGRDVTEDIVVHYILRTNGENLHVHNFGMLFISWFAQR